MGKKNGENILVENVNDGCVQFGLSFFVPFYRETSLYHWVVGYFALGIRNGKDELEGNSSGFAESLNRFTWSSGLQFNKYKYSSWLGTGLSANLLLGSDTEFRP